MKIAINGDIMDTKDFYSITKIFILEDCQYFKIISFNKNEYIVKYIFNTVVWNHYDNKKSKHGHIVYLCKDKKILKFFDEKETNSDKKAESFRLNTSHYKNEIEKFKKIRQSIVNIWSNNQSKIPQFNL
jgi:hypothetical protein